MVQISEEFVAKTALSCRGTGRSRKALGKLFQSYYNSTGRMKTVWPFPFLRSEISPSLDFPEDLTYERRETPPKGVRHAF